ncbi:MAG: hypothetical protein A2136_04030 [Chloroflexi bacterium RBG_16_54_11]|nr:MAG: hypothetical protein A2136_04030 [Chloroflexi bacterium RBG_16_54_11]
MSDLGEEKRKHSRLTTLEKHKRFIVGKNDLKKGLIQFLRDHPRIKIHEYTNSANMKTIHE